MRIRPEFIHRSIAGEHLVIPTGKPALEIKGMICLTGCSGLVVEKLKEECSKEDILNAICEQFSTTRPEAEADLDVFLGKMRKLNMLMEN